MTERRRARCGLDCGGCDLLAATRAGDREALARLAAKWTPDAMKHWARDPLRPEDMVCAGCAEPDDRVCAGARHCPARRCCMTRGYEHCGFCDELDSCERVRGIHEGFPEARARLGLG